MKKYLALLLALSMILALAACGQSAAPAQTEAAPAEQADSAPAEEEVDYSGYTIRIYSNSNSTERTTWLIQEAKDAGFTISIDDNPKVPRHAGVLRGEHRGSRHRFL